MTNVAVAFLVLFVVALALLIVAIANLDELTDENRALKKAAAARCRYLELEKQLAAVIDEDDAVNMLRRALNHSRRRNGRPIL